MKQRRTLFLIVFLVMVHSISSHLGHISIAIYTVIADSLVNEIFGDNMIPLNLKDVKERSGSFCIQKFLVMRDKDSGRIAIPVQRGAPVHRRR